MANDLKITLWVYGPISRLVHEAFLRFSGDSLGLLHAWERQKTSARIKECEVRSLDILAGMKRR
jgi:hypothetical protein